MTLYQKTLIAGVVGILFGIVFGVYCSYLQPIGDLYVSLLQVAVYPYVISSLLKSLGSLVPRVALRICKQGWIFYVLLVFISLLTIFLLSLSIPASASSITIGKNIDFPIVHTLMALLIPSNPFTALSLNYVPAIILFCVLYGVMLQHVKEKNSLFESLDAISKASLEFWNRLVAFSPYAVFALFANTSGTINLVELRALGVYFILFFVGTLSLAFWIIPALISSLTGVKQKTIFAELREGLLLALGTSLSVAALPFIQQFTCKMLAERSIETTESLEIVQTVSSVSYAFAQVGNCFLYLFMLFSAYYVAHPLAISEQMLLPIMGYLSSIGSPSATVNSVAFLADWLRLPASASSLYVETMALTRYPQVLASVMGIAGLTILMTLAYYGKLKVQWKKLHLHFFIIAAFFAIFLLGMKTIQPYIFVNKAASFNTFQLDDSLTSDVEVTLIRPGEPIPLNSENLSEDSFKRIEDTHILRVGYNPNVAPFCYFNTKNELVGYDVAMVYALARALHSKIIFIPFSWDQLLSNLENNQFDLAIGGIYASPNRLAKVNLTKPYFTTSLALVVPEAKKNTYLELNPQQLPSGLRIGIFEDPILAPIAHKYFQDASIIILPDYNHLAEEVASHNIDVAIWTQEQAEVWVTEHPGYAAIIPYSLSDSLAQTFLTQKTSPEFLAYLNYWLDLKELDGFTKKQYQQWILGKPPVKTSPRWNIIDYFFKH